LSSSLFEHEFKKNNVKNVNAIKIDFFILKFVLIVFQK
jgi:hypothetical protein